MRLGEMAGQRQIQYRFCGKKDEVFVNIDRINII